MPTGAPSTSSAAGTPGRLRQRPGKHLVGQATCATSYVSPGHYGVQAFFSGLAPFDRSGSAVLHRGRRPTRTGVLGGHRPTARCSGPARRRPRQHPDLGGRGAVVGIAATLDGPGYWVVTADGTVSAFGDARFYGDLPDLAYPGSGHRGHRPHHRRRRLLPGRRRRWLLHLRRRQVPRFAPRHPRARTRDVVGMVPRPAAPATCWWAPTAACSASVKAASTARCPASASMCTTSGPSCPLPPAGATSWWAPTAGLSASVPVRFHGSLPGEGVRVADIVGIALTPDDGGYYMAGSDGRVYGFGDAQAGREPAGVPPTSRWRPSPAPSRPARGAGRLEQGRLEQGRTEQGRLEQGRTEQGRSAPCSVPGRRGGPPGAPAPPFRAWRSR